MAECNQIAASLEFWDFTMSPEDLSVRLGLDATESWKQGDPTRFVPGRRHRRNFWKLESPLPDSAPLEDHVKALLAQIKPFKDRFREVASECVFLLECSVRYYTGSVPSIVFDRDVVRVLSELNATIDVDFSVLCVQDENIEP